MTPALIGLVTLACVFGAALAGLFLRSLLPEHHLSSGSSDTIKVAIAMVATLTALVLGLLIASAKTSFDSKVTALKDDAAKVILLDRTLRQYGSDTKELRDFFRQLVIVRIRQFWPEEHGVDVAPSAVSEGNGVEQLQQRLLALSPTDDAQRWLKSKALDLESAIEATRWQGFEQLSTSIQWPLLVIVVFWLVAIFLSFGLFAPVNMSVIVALFVAALSVAGSIYLILELDQPYSGAIKISSAPLQMAVQVIGSP